MFLLVLLLPMSPVDLLLTLIILLMAVLIFAVALTFAIHLWWGVPYVPTPLSIVRTMIKAAKLQSGEVVYDLGAGDARLLIEAKRAQPGIRAIGFEVVPTIWLLGILRIAFSRVRVVFRCRSLFKQNLSDANVVFLYLSPSMMKRLAIKFTAELKPGTRVISNGFYFKDREPSETISSPVFLWGKQRVFVYIW